MASFCDNGSCSQAGNDSCGGFGNLSGFRGGRSFSFYRDQCQDVPPSSFKNIGNFLIPSGLMRGTAYVNLNGEVTGKFSGKIEGLSGVLGCMGNLSNFGLSIPFSFQMGNRNL